MQQGKKLFAGLLACVMLLGAFPVQALATETEECTHQYETNTVTPTCVQGGYTTYKCVLCGDAYTDEETDPTGVCAPKAVDEQPATCLQEGTAAHYACPDCGKKYLDEAATLPAADADLVLPLTACDITYMPGAQATCQHIGVRLYFYCKVCNTKYLDAAGKQKVTDYEAEVLLPITECELSNRLEVPATCQQTGVARHRYCIHCGKLYWNDEARTPVADEAELILPVVDHSFGQWEVVEFPAPEQAGKEIRTCKYCGLQEEQEIPGLTWDLETPVLKVKQEKETGMPLLSWNEVPGAEAYVVCRMLEEDLEETQEIKLEVLGATMATEVIDISADPGVSYLYTVYALSSTSYSDISDLKAGIAKCAAPELDVTTHATTGKAVLSWDAVEGAQSYEIYRSTSSSSGYKKVATTQDCSWTMTSGTTGSKYYYKVKAVCSNTAGNSNYSDVISHVCACPQPVAEVQSGETQGIKLTWGKVTGAKKYQIFRADSLNGLYTYIATTSNAYYTDTKAPANQVSYYKVAAYGSSTNSLGVRSEPVWLMNHTFGSWETILPAMPETEGWKERTCSYCGYVEGAAIPVLTRSLSTPQADPFHQQRLR